MAHDSCVLSQAQREENGFLVANYGIAMFNAQTLEQAIALLRMSIEFGSLRDYPDDPDRTKAKAQNVFDAFWKDVQKNAVGVHLSFFQKHLAADFHDELRTWIGRRNEIAHRFLVRHYVATGSQAHTFKPGTLEKIVAFYTDCKPLEAKVFGEAERRVRTANIPQPVREMGMDFIHTVMLRDDWPE